VNVTPDRVEGVSLDGIKVVVETELESPPCLARGQIHVHPKKLFELGDAILRLENDRYRIETVPRGDGEAERGVNPGGRNLTNADVGRGVILPATGAQVEQGGDARCCRGKEGDRSSRKEWGGFHVGRGFCWREFAFTAMPAVAVQAREDKKKFKETL